MMIRLTITFFLLFLLSYSTVWSQCCAIGTGSPIAGGGSQGVLAKGQAEVNINYQRLYTRKFLTGDKPAQNFLSNYNSNYSYLRFSYGLSKQLTVSVESGYYLNKTQVGLDGVPITSGGIGDIIIFPRYLAYNKKKSGITTEVCLGLGYKIPLGSNNVLVKETEPFSGEEFSYRAPPAIQLTTGAQDVIFYTFFYKHFSKQKLKLFTTTFYIKKGWNSLGEKFGDFASVSFFASKTYWDKLGVILQLRGEWVDKMKYNEDVYLAGKLNYDMEATGTKSIFLSPQVSYTLKKKLTFYVLRELPLYQYVNKTQAAMQRLTTAGIVYRFNLKDCEEE